MMKQASSAERYMGRSGNVQPPMTALRMYSYDELAMERTMPQQVGNKAGLSARAANPLRLAARFFKMFSKKSDMDPPAKNCT